MINWVENSTTISTVSGNKYGFFFQISTIINVYTIYHRYVRTVPAVVEL